jgi:hypothetical protein
MEATVIVIISLSIVWLIVTMLRDHFKSKWYERGYVEAARKYDNYDNCPKGGYGKEAKDKFYEEYGFHYD